MNRSHDWTDSDVMKTTAAAEGRVCALERPPADPELAADWALRQELKSFQQEDVPTDVAERWKHALRPRRRWIHSAWGLATAACVVAALSLTILLPAPEVEPDQIALEDFQLAMQTVDTTSRVALSITGRELNEHLQWPAIELEPLPYSRLVRALAQSRPVNAQTENQTNQHQVNQE